MTYMLYHQKVPSRGAKMCDACTCGRADQTQTKSGTLFDAIMPADTMYTEVM